ncbi:YceI family protein [Lewinella sp. 4G2]|uniref:YceI family protein n=1 Tax=Lewinella sp. 4G2 TaxID=1803372 RepID=UPI0007B463FA|nr:YceI family protein [Lewinella sp. 4G2]
MKHLFSLLFLSVFIVACGGPEGQEVTAGEAIEEGTEVVKSEASTQYLVDPTASKIMWEGTKVIGGGHTGEIPVENGQIIVTNEGQRIVGGQFAMDLRKMTNTDMPADEGGDKLIGHLKAPDFFDVAKYPMATFDLKSVQPKEGEEYTHELMGNLTLKGIAKSVKIPATVTFADGKLMAKTPKFTIDRNEWGISYNNSTFDLAKDRIISDEIGLQIDLVANED